MSELSKVTFFLDPKLHEDLKIRIYYDNFGNLSEFFRGCVVSYLEKNNQFMEFLDAYKGASEQVSQTTQERRLVDGEVRNYGGRSGKYI